MYKEFSKTLHILDEKILNLDDRQIQQGFESVPLEIFSKLQIDRPAEFPNLMKWLPVMPSTAVQQSWTGNSDHELMKQSVSFLKTTVGKYHEIAGKPLNRGHVLDFGCGWGRLIRLLYKYVPAESIYGVDPWDQSIDLCHQTHLHGNIALSDYLPVSLPVPSSIKFDLVIAFSVFTHLSERAFNACAEVIQQYMSPNGVLALTIRPVEFWTFIHGTTPFFAKIDLSQKLEDHEQRGFAFFPHEREKVLGDITYGESTVSIDYLMNAFSGMKLCGIEWSEIDPLQIVVFLQKGTE
ncbi:MAG: class I SAM-dependent methyltransferase [Bacteroidales bacterium]|nr:class I SAM-dependent methyltransferase [Bacteroidales bacterium]